MSFPPTASASRQHTTRPTTTGTSVLGIVYDKGVLLAADTLLSYGSMAKAQGVPRLKVVSHANCIVGASGEYSDFQAVIDLLERKALEEETSVLSDSLYTSKPMSASQIWNYLRFVMYSKRNKFDPYWNDLVVAGTDSTTGKPFLGMIDKIGTTVQENFIATGYGGYMALPLLREKWRPDLTEGEARALLEDCMKVLFYRDCRASSRIQLAKAEAAGAEASTFIVSDPYDLDMSGGWDAPSFVEAKGDLDGDGGW
eukprot:CAMPEP_0172457152 /NCGR_PEP_ID=MMETSP1065-20121228/20349_1 /TAXON_ID=265537 /ORGANISM="Amphiprora paludosa, Strain CCMP125" /LENGTH=254 /DNA_ID=CAMNT_0013210703 /DNA_START=121 /DNA_END=885 /DNA_ORIENTATION=+